MKNIFFSILYYFGILSLLGFINRHKAIILLYHGVSENIIKGPIRNSKYLHIDAPNFRRQMQYLKKKYNILSIEDLCEIIESHRKIPAYSVVITFDDGYRNVFDNGYPVLRDYGIRASSFLNSRLMLNNAWQWLDKLEYMVDTTKLKVVDILGQRHNLENNKLKSEFLNFIRNRLKKMNAQIRDMIMEELISKLEVTLPQYPCDEYRLMNYEQARQMADNGLVSFGAHTPEHTILTLEELEQARGLILESKREISGHLDRNVDLFSYPNGSYNNRIKEMLKKEGFRCALTTDCGMNNAQADLFALKRISVGAQDTLIPFIAHLSGIREYTASFMGFLRKIAHG